MRLGVFDSGVGGLTVVREIKGLYSELIYLGDTSRAPYGTRSDEEIERFGEQCLQFVLKSNPDAVVIACNTVSAVAGERLKRLSSVPIFGMIETVVSVVNPVIGKIVVLGTEATIRSGVYEKALKIRGFEEVVSIPCPDLVRVVESGEEALVMATIKKYLLPIKNCSFDGIVLGCTHFPVVEDQIKIFTGLPIIKSGEGLKRILSPCQFKDEQFFVTGDLTRFSHIGSRILGREIIPTEAKIR